MEPQVVLPVPWTRIPAISAGPAASGRKPLAAYVKAAGLPSADKARPEGTTSCRKNRLTCMARSRPSGCPSGPAGASCIEPRANGNCPKGVGRATLVRVSVGPVRYERPQTDGTVGGSALAIETAARLICLRRRASSRSGGMDDRPTVAYSRRPTRHVASTSSTRDGLRERILAHRCSAEL